MIFNKKGEISVEELKEAIVTPDGKLRCPVCGAINGELVGDEVVKNLRIRCRKSRRNKEHSFILNLGGN